MSENVVAAGATFQSAERVLALLTSFDDSRPEQGVTELAQTIGVHKSTASRLAAVLERAGLLARHGRRYRLGLETIRLGTLALRSFDIVEAMRPAMDKLSQQTGETINLAVPDGTGILNVAEVPATFILGCSSGWTGRRTRPHAVANGKVLLAHAAIPVPRHLERYTDQTITDPERAGRRAGPGPDHRLRHRRRGTRGRPGRGGRAGPRRVRPPAWRHCRCPGPRSG